jgi:hypothetical protein
MKLDINNLARLITKSLPLQKWNFEESVRTDLAIIFNSPWCRIKFYIERRRSSNDAVLTYYGRLHALDEALIMKWNGEDCYCWHGYKDLHVVLKFLDGLSPQEAYKTFSVRHHLFSNYFNSNLAIDANEETGERSIMWHSVIWENYGLKFFQLFDLRRPDLWKQYLAYLKEYYELHDKEREIAHKRRGFIRISNTPSPYKKC